jgi:hypothetical protein
MLTLNAMKIDGVRQAAICLGKPSDCCDRHWRDSLAQIARRRSKSDRHSRDRPSVYQQARSACSLCGGVEHSKRPDQPKVLMGELSRVSMP